LFAHDAAIKKSVITDVIVLKNKVTSTESVAQFVENPGKQKGGTFTDQLISYVSAIPASQLRQCEKRQGQPVISSDSI